MTTLMKECTMAFPSRDCDEGFMNRGRSELDDRSRGGRVRCMLKIARTNLPVDLPLEVLEKFRLLRSGEIILRLPGGEIVPVTTRPVLTDAQQRAADRWVAEMEDFDRF